MVNYNNSLGRARETYEQRGLDDILNCFSLMKVDRKTGIECELIHIQRAIFGAA